MLSSRAETKKGGRVRGPRIWRDATVPLADGDELQIHHSISMVDNLACLTMEVIAWEVANRTQLILKLKKTYGASKSPILQRISNARYRPGWKLRSNAP